MALVRTITQVPDTFEDLAMKLNSFLPQGFKRIDLVADSYLPMHNEQISIQSSVSSVIKNHFKVNIVENST